MIYVVAVDRECAAHDREVLTFWTRPTSVKEGLAQRAPDRDSRS
jgi:hypothetical protein